MFKTILNPKFNGRMNYTNHEMDGIYPRSLRSCYLICRSYATRDELNCNGIYDLGFTLKWSSRFYRVVFSGEPRWINLIYEDVKKKISASLYVNGSIYLVFPDTDEELISFVKERYYKNLGETLSELYKNSLKSEKEIPSYNEEIDKIIEIKKMWLD